MRRAATLWILTSGTLVLVACREPTAPTERAVAVQLRPVYSSGAPALTRQSSGTQRKTPWRSGSASLAGRESGGTRERNR